MHQLKLSVQWHFFFFYFSQIKQVHTNVDGIFLMSKWWMSFPSAVCVQSCRSWWLKCPEPLGFTSMVVRITIIINIHHLMCWVIHMELNLRSRSLHVRKNTNDFSPLDIYVVTPAILWSQFCAGKSEGSGLVPSTQAFIWHGWAPSIFHFWFYFLFLIALSPPRGQMLTPA